MIFRTSGVLLLALALAAPGRTAAQQRPLSVKDVMARVAAYVEAYGARTSVVVATEHYSQQSRRYKAMPEKRQLGADFAIVKVDGMRGWQGFRDVIEVDGTPLPDRNDRLARLLTHSGGYDEARRLLAESARFNIGPIERDFNVPTTTLFFFTPQNLDRFRFSAVTAGADGIWEIAFRETARPTLIRTPRGRSIASSGTLWVHAADGTVVRTRLEVEGFAMSSTLGNRSRGTGSVDVVYQRVPALDMWLPASMDEDFEIRTGEHREGISGRALYSNYRQFTTSARIK
ncbi:MAG TPA: hypothetical protein VFK57_20315 [Vicinamibacterales bacterium]|nr:hypothetical protein [Vicinamibacterales bacterium]